ncbi:hypothetical protein KI387_005174, partial [Taxus chinensis]
MQNFGLTYGNSTNSHIVGVQFSTTVETHGITSSSSLPAIGGGSGAIVGFGSGGSSGYGGK